MYIYNCKDNTYKYTVITPFYFHRGIGANYIFSNSPFAAWVTNSDFGSAFPTARLCHDSAFPLPHDGCY